MRKMLAMALVMVPVAVLALTPQPAVKVTDEPLSAAVVPVLRDQQFARVRIDTLVSYIRYLFEHKQALLLKDPANPDDPYFFFAYNDAQSHITTVVFNESQMMDPASWIVQDILTWSGSGTLRYVSPSAYWDGSTWYPQVTFNCYSPSYEGYLYDEGGLGAGIWTNPVRVTGPVYDYYLPLTDTGPDNVIFMDGQARDVAGDSHIFKKFSGVDGTMIEPPGEVMIFPSEPQYGPNPVYGQGYENSQLVYCALNNTIAIALGGYWTDQYSVDPLTPVLRTSTDGGLTWSDYIWLNQTTVPTIPGGYPGIDGHYSNSFFDLAFDDLGFMHVLAVIADSGFFGNASYIHGLYDIHQTAQGWVATRVTDGVYPNLNPREIFGDSYMHSPSLAWGEDGTLVAAWNDVGAIDWSDTSVSMGIYMSYSHDRGATWSTPQVVTAEAGVDEYFSRLVQSTFVPTSGNECYAYILTMPTGGSNGPLDMIKVPYPRNPGGSALTKPVVETLQVVGPNPSKGRVTVSLSLATAANVQAAVYNLRGQIVDKLHEGPLAAGRHQLVWDGNAPAGVYLVRATAAGQSVSAKVVLVH